jgi:hypothetical protein
VRVFLLTTQKLAHGGFGIRLELRDVSDRLLE